jgi:hypothetical protein
MRFLKLAGYAAVYFLAARGAAGYAEAHPDGWGSTTAHYASFVLSAIAGLFAVLTPIGGIMDLATKKGIPDAE